MAITNHERVGKALDLLRAGLAPFIEREFKSTFGQRAQNELIRVLGEDRLKNSRGVGCSGAAQGDVGLLERRVPEDPGVCREKSAFRTARLAKQMGASGAVFDGRRLPHARFVWASAQRDLGPRSRGGREDENRASAPPLR